MGSLAERMKGYESVSRLTLTRRLPLIVRVDGRAFHTFTRQMHKPWDPAFVDAMQQVALTLGAEVDGCQLAYVQSDEVSLLVRDDFTLQTQPWFDKDLQKIVSVCAGIASATFTRTLGRFAVFDARAFVLPPAEVCNYFVWRQQDAVRNSVQALGHAHFTDDELHGKSGEQIQELLFQKHGLNWNDTPAALKRGACAVKAIHEITGADGPVRRTRWEMDVEIPTFTQDRAYVERLLLDGHSGDTTG